MRRYLPLLLFIGLAWGQENPDTLTYHNGPKFSGRFLGIIFGGNEIFGGVKFETVDKKIVKPPIKSIQKLSINAFTIIKNGKWVVEKDFVKISEGNINQQSYDTYQKSTLLERQQDYQQGVAAAKKDYEAIKYDLSYPIFPPQKKSRTIVERAVNHATADARKWLFYQPLIIGLSGVSSLSYFFYTGEPSANISILSLYGSYSLFTAYDKKNIVDVIYFKDGRVERGEVSINGKNVSLKPKYSKQFKFFNTDFINTIKSWNGDILYGVSSKDFDLYKKIYFKEFKKRKFENIMISTVAVGLIATAGIFAILSNLDFGDGIYLP